MENKKDIDFEVIENLLTQIRPDNTNLILKMLLVPPKKEWNQFFDPNTPEAPGILDAPNEKQEEPLEEISLPLLIMSTSLISSLTERQETLLENVILNGFENIAISRNHVRVSPKAELDNTLLNLTLTQEQFNLFTPLFREQKVVCIEFNIYISKEEGSTPNLLSCVAGLWDDSNNNWLFGPFTTQKEVW